MRSLVVALIALTACGEPQRTTTRRQDCPSDHPLGTPSDYTPPELPGIVISAPEMCPKGEAYIRVERTTGTRRFAVNHDEAACLELPADPTDTTKCPVIQPWSILTAARIELEKGGIQGIGDGLGPCGDSDGDWDAWRVSSAVHEWKQAETLIRLVAAQLDRYDIGGHVGVAVRGIQCAVAL